ncbi:rhamnogalacturonan acetylesterase RgaE [Fomitiporia mediterranea MF3/22]|uniref:rhamnogalacturonan acetylesterase RgaE n=1 Tax=Fomitiporia mediterranea (strain MF3/22) TaxID=694068 RepID=UPI00044079D8|nr:rhamnogalacturonan acetylesterase RgaE [Fomitiporia mediterranea MF3/22]EJD00179.1 rhamnogalacturonan acetylesterase RgaE [Fomitiporia mediterranea MF3/22]
MLSKLAAGLTLAVTCARAATLYLAGDSTMAANDGNDAVIGWGVFIGNYLNISVVNDAVAGRSSRSYTDEGRFSTIIDTVKPGDIVVIEFGHNDGGGPSASTRGVCPGADTTTTCNVNGTIVFTFNKYIEDAVNSLQGKSAKVIVSSQTPDNPYDVGFAPSRFVGYAQTAAKDTGASYVDHFDLVIEQYRAMREAAVNALYPVDHTHTSPTGADIVAQTFVRGVLCDTSNPLFPFVSNKTVVPSNCV